MTYGGGVGGLAKDETKAVELFRKACDGGEIPACGNLGVMHMYGLGGLAKDETKAAELYRKACDGGVAKFCGNLRAVDQSAPTP
jgi:TPR repeat protein